MIKTIEQIAVDAKNASIDFMGISGYRKNLALKEVAKYLESRKKEILAANKKDLENAKRESLAAPLLNRLKFDEKKLKDAIDGILSLVEIEDPVGKTSLSNQLDNRLNLYRVSSPIGVIGVIFESRPDALVQIAALCLKSSNSVILKGGSEASNTNKILAEIIQTASVGAGLPMGWINLLMSRTDVTQLLKMDGYVDLLIPRGSNEFVKMIMENTKIPVLGHADGVCHTYIDKDANIKMAIDIVFDAKSQYPSACNATESILIHDSVKEEVLPQLFKRFKENKIEILGCEQTCKLIDCKPVEDWHTEYLDLKVSVKIVKDLKEAITHINKYGSGHTDAIVSEKAETVRLFMAYVDSGNVFHNCSTRFSDGFRYGFGAEVGISTSKIHARGPVGLEGLVTYKYKLFGNGQVVDDYSTGKAKFKHKAGNDKSPF